MRRQMASWVLAGLVCVQLCMGAGEPQEVVGSISNVIVYRGQAQVTRNIALDLPPGGRELVVKELPEGIIVESLHAMGVEGVSISSVRYREKEAAEDTRQEVKGVQAQIEQVKNDQYQAKRDNDISRVLWERFEGYWGMSLNAAQADLNRALLQPESIEAVTAYLESRSVHWHEQWVETEFRQRELQKKLAELEKKLKELQAGRTKVEREAVITVNSPESRRAVIELSYLVRGANWLPQYNLRAEPENGSVRVEYNALLHQTSGEDWDGVSLSLSTAQPSMMSAPPELEPMEVKLGSGERAQFVIGQDGPAMVKKQELGEVTVGQRVYRDLSSEFKKVQSRRRAVAVRGKAAQTELNMAAFDNQMMELQADKDAVQTIQAAAESLARTEGISVTYNLPGRLSMPSKKEQQLLGIGAFGSPADFVMIGTPMLTDYVYLQGDATNDSDVIMLAGPASMYRDGEFVGKGQMELVTIGEKFTTGFGVDSQVKMYREFEDKKIDTLWRSRVEQYDYRIAIDNYKNKKVKLRLFERIPYTEDEELEIKDFQTNTPLSTDAEYLRTDRKKGMLRWDLELGPNTTGEKATVVTYGYTMKYANDMRIQSERAAR